MDINLFGDQVEMSQHTTSSLKVRLASFHLNLFRFVGDRKIVMFFSQILTFRRLRNGADVYISSFGSLWFDCIPVYH